jgi:hypothetical protein
VVFHTIDYINFGIPTGKNKEERAMNATDKMLFRITDCPGFLFPIEHIEHFVNKKLIDADTTIYATNGQSYRAGELVANPSNVKEETMKTNVLDTPLFFFNDQRFRYSINQIRSLIEDGKTAPDTPIRIAEATFRADDIVVRVAPMLCECLLSETDKDATPLPILP